MLGGARPHGDNGSRPLGDSLSPTKTPERERRGEEGGVGVGWGGGWGGGGGELVEKHLGRNLVPSAMKVFESQYPGEAVRGLNVHTQLCCTEDFLNLFQMFHIFMEEKKNVMKSRGIP